MVALLAAVAIALSGQPSLVLECGPLPVPVVSGQHALGNATADPPHIWIVPILCKSAYRREHYGLQVLAHEILHVRPNRSEEWTRRWDDWYAENVVRWKMRRLAQTGRGEIMPAALVAVAGVQAAGYKVTQTDRGVAFGAERFQTTIEKPITGAASDDGGGIARHVGYSGVSQAAADTAAIAGLNAWRNHRYGAGTAVSASPKGGSHTLDVT